MCVRGRRSSCRLSCCRSCRRPRRRHLSCSRRCRFRHHCDFNIAVVHVLFLFVLVFVIVVVWVVVSIVVVLAVVYPCRHRSPSSPLVPLEKARAPSEEPRHQEPDVFHMTKLCKFYLRAPRLSHPPVARPWCTALLSHSRSSAACRAVVVLAVVA